MLFSESHRLRLKVKWCQVSCNCIFKCGIIRIHFHWGRPIFWGCTKQWDMSGSLMAFNDPSDCGTTERWVPFNPVVLKRLASTHPVMILLFHCKYFRAEFRFVWWIYELFDDKILLYKIIIEIAGLGIFYIPVSSILEQWTYNLTQKRWHIK